MATDDLLTTSEVCDALQVGSSTISRWVADGRLEPARKLPGLRGAFLFRRSDVVAIASEAAS
jgi:excisionase family DNA binding protein